jgi:hypothetical protein
VLSALAEQGHPQSGATGFLPNCEEILPNRQAMEGIAMKIYDPLKPPDPEEWPSLDEQERLQLVQDFHLRARIRLPNAKVHAVIHVVVENQIALGDETPAKRTVQRLMSEGLDRHDAIHAVGLVLAEHMNNLLAKPEAEIGQDSNLAYYKALEQLTAKDWLASG